MSIASMLARVRLEFNDITVPFQDAFNGDGETTTYDLTVAKVVPGSVTVNIEGVPTAAWTMDEDAGVLVLDDPVPFNGRLVVAGTAHEFFSEEELAAFLNEAFLKHTHGQYPPQTLEDPPPEGYVPLPAVEHQLVAILTVIDALWALAVNASFDINVTTAEGTMIPVGQRFQQIMMLIQMLRERYLTMAQMLNVGLERIQMFELRRRSKTTNRLVPIYIEREYDDRTFPPVRVLPPVDRKVT